VKFRNNSILFHHLVISLIRQKTHVVADIVIEFVQKLDQRLIRNVEFACDLKDSFLNSQTISPNGYFL